MNVVAAPAERRPLPKPLIYRERDLRALTSLSRKAREDGMRAGTFPKPIPIGPKARGWLSSEVEQWVEARKAARDAARAGRAGAIQWPVCHPPLRRSFIHRGNRTALADRRRPAAHIRIEA